MNFSRGPSSFLPAALGLLLLATYAHAQETNKKAESNPQSSIVLLNVRVTDEAGRAVSDVRQEDVRVVEDGVPQTISFFSKEELPLRYGLLVDNSGSMRTQIGEIIETGKIIVESNRPNDETFLVRFIAGNQIDQISDFTSNKRALLNALDGMFVEGGQTAVVDAVYASVEHVAKNRGSVDGNRRHALVLITDGEDRGSRFKRAQLAELLHKEDIQIFVVGLTSRVDDRKKAVDLLNFLAQETGGRAFFPKSTAELRGIAEEITRDLRTQYLVGYIPASGKAGNAFHKVQVTVAESQGKGKRVAVTRVGYISAPRANP